MLLLCSLDTTTKNNFSINFWNNQITYSSKQTRLNCWLIENFVIVFMCFFPWNLVLMSNFLFSLDLIWSWISLLWHWFSWSWFERHHWWPQGLHSRLQCLSPRHPNPHSIGTIKTHQQASKDVLRSPLYVRAHHMFSRILYLRIHEKNFKKISVCFSIYEIQFFIEINLWKEMSM